MGNVNNEDGETFGRKEDREKTGESASTQDSVIGSECLVSVRSPSVSSRSRLQVSVTAFAPTQVQRQCRMPWPPNGRNWSDRSDGWKSNTSQSW